MITQIDFAILDAIQKIGIPVLDVIFKVITTLGDGGVIWILSAIIMLCFKKTRKCSVMMIIALVLGTLIGNVTLKPLIARPRPFIQNPDMLTNLIIKAPGGYSFPSGHTLSSFECATAMFLFDKKFGIPAFILAALIGFSRLYLYVHVPTDVIAGALLGIAIGFISKIIFEKIDGIKKKGF